jgi:hypothetical protein
LGEQKVHIWQALALFCTRRARGSCRKDLEHQVSYEVETGGVLQVLVAQRIFI